MKGGVAADRLAPQTDAFSFRPTSSSAHSRQHPPQQRTPVQHTAPSLLNQPTKCPSRPSCQEVTRAAAAARVEPASNDLGWPVGTYTCGRRNVRDDGLLGGSAEPPISSAVGPEKRLSGKATSVRTDVRTDSSPSAASRCSSLPLPLVALAAPFSCAQFVSARYAGLLIPRSQVRFLPGPSRESAAKVVQARAL